MDMRIPPLNIKILLESNPLKYRMFVGRLDVTHRKWLFTCGWPIGDFPEILNQAMLVGIIANNNHHNTSDNTNDKHSNSHKKRT